MVKYFVRTYHKGFQEPTIGILSLRPTTVTQITLGLLLFVYSIAKVPSSQLGTSHKKMPQDIVMT